MAEFDCPPKTEAGPETVRALSDGDDHTLDYRDIERGLISWPFRAEWRVLVNDDGTQTLEPAGAVLFR